MGGTNEQPIEPGTSQTCPACLQAKDSDTGKPARYNSGGSPQMDLWNSGCHPRLGDAGGCIFNVGHFAQALGAFRSRLPV